MPAGRKGKYEYWITKDGLLLLQGWARDGLTDEQIAHNIGINPATLYDWKNKFPEINKTLKTSKEIIDYAVENALLKSAMAGNTTAQIFWLKNRRRAAWRDNPAEDMTAALEKLDGVLAKLGGAE